jgi:hypothetical protein
MARDNQERRVASYKARGKSVMFSAHFEDGRTAYFVIQGHGTSEEDYLALDIARERQRKGELPDGGICSVKRVR